MRIKINLVSEPNTTIPIEYNYNIYLSLRRMLFKFLSENKPKLHSRFKKEFPAFTFSQLMIPERKIELGFIEITGKYLSFFISSIDVDFIEYLVKALNSEEQFLVHEKRFPLKKIEILEEPEFEEVMKFRMLSPLLLIKVEDEKPVFLRPGDSDLGDVFSEGLVKRYNTVHRTMFKPGDIRFELDQHYMERKRKLTRLLTIRNIHFKTILAPFFLRGAPELIRFAYHSGIGEKTHFGMGMIDVV